MGGVRNTSQRKAIQRAFERAGRPLSVQECLEEAQTEMVGLGIATVYRNVKRLLEEGFLETVDIPGDSARYELAGLDHHHHFHCRSCDKVFDVSSCTGGVDKLAPQGFSVESHEIILYGLCVDCL